MKMGKIIEGERQKGFTRLTGADGRSEDFTNIYGGLSFPFEETPGLILIGGLVHDDTGCIKILAEKEFRTLSECAALIDEFQPIYQLRYLYHQEGSENEAFAAFLKNEKSSLSIEVARYSDNISFAISLINDYLANDKLLLPRGGIVAKQLQSDWGGNASERTLHGIVALCCLLSGVNFDSHLFDPIDLEAGR
jgi:hypothetical protein